MLQVTSVAAGMEAVRNPLIRLEVANSKNENPIVSRNAATFLEFDTKVSKIKRSVHVIRLRF